MVLMGGLSGERSEFGLRRREYRIAEGDGKDRRASPEP
jgi:hypothetical protein